MKKTRKAKEYTEDGVLKSCINCAFYHYSIDDYWCDNDGECWPDRTCNLWDARGQTKEVIRGNQVDETTRRIAVPSDTSD